MKISSCIALFLWFSCTVLSQETINLTFNNGESFEVTIHDNNPVNHPSKIFNIDFFDFRLNNAATGPFALGPSAQIWDALNAHSLYFRGFYTPLGYKLLEDLNGENHFQRVELEGGVRYQFREFSGTKKNTKLTVGTDGNTIYTLKTDWPKITSLSARGGIFFNQRAINKDIAIEDVIIEGNSQSANLKLEGSRTIMAYAGISLLRKLNIDLESQKTARSSTFQLREIYLDLLYSPVTLIHGGERYFDSFSSEFQYLQSGKIDKDKYISEFPVNNLGFRFGIQRKTSIGSMSKLGQNIGMEISYLPGLNGYNFEWTFIKYGVMIY